MISFEQKLRPLYPAVAAALLLAACGRAPSFSGDYAPEASAPSASMKAAPSPEGALADSDTSRVDLAAAVPDSSTAVAATAERTRKLIRSASVQIRVADTATAERKLLAALAARGGYAASSRMDAEVRSYTLRLPAAAFDDFLGTLGTLGKVLSRSESAEDVTLQFYDLAGRLQTKQELLATFRSYLAKAATIDELLTVESRIADLQQELKWLGTELKTLADLSDFATIELELLPPASTVGYAEPTLPERLGYLLRSFGGYVQTLAVVLVGAVVFGLPAVLLLAVLYWLLLGHIGLLRRLWRLVNPPKPPKA